MELEPISFSVYRNAVPPEIESAMEDLYQHRYASFMQLKLYGHLNDDIHTYVARKKDRIVTALIFRIEQRKVRVLNEQMHLDEEDINRFAQHVFDTFKEADVISFPVVQTEIRRLAFPHQQCHATLDIVLTLPTSAQEYTSQLGKSTRSYVKRYLNKIRRDFPSYTFEVYVNDEIKEAHVRDIIRFNRERMSERQQTSYIDEAEERRMLALLKVRGLVCIMKIQGRICAGTINFRFGDNYFLQVLAHDPTYNDYGMGTLCCYLTICECIERRGNAYHFLWGQYEYKYRLLGVQRDLDHVAVYRSRFHQVRRARMALGLAVAGHRYTARSWLLNKARRKDDTSMASRFIFHLIHGLKSCKRAINGFRHKEESKPLPSAGVEHTGR